MKQRCLITAYLLLFVITGFDTFGQTRKIDSLRHILYTAETNDKKLQALLHLCEQGGSMSTDSFSRHAFAAKELALKLKNRDRVLQAEYHITNALARKERLDTAISITERILAEHPKQFKNKDIWLRFAIQKARFYDRSNEYTKAITQLYEVLNAAELWRDTTSQVQAKTGIGWVQLEMERYEEALEWFFEALHSSGNTFFLKEYSALYSNIASAYNKLGRNDSAHFYITKAISYGREAQSLTFLATSLNIAADIYSDLGQAHKVEAALNESVQIRKQLNDSYYTVYDISRLANWYANTGNWEKGIEVCESGIAIARQLGLSSQLQLIYYALAENYKVAGDKAMYAQTLEKIISLKDSFNTINSSNLLTELQARYEAQRQENTIIQQRLDISEKNNIIYGSIALVLLASVTGYFLFRDYKRKQRRKMVELKEEEKRMGEKAVAEAEEKERKRIAADLHDNLGAYANSVLHGTELLQQETRLVESKALVQDLHVASKDIITSLRETIWALKKETYTAEDCLLRVRNFIQPLNRYYEPMHFEVKGEAPQQFVLQNSKALHLVRMLQEGITNAIKHSEAKNVLVISQPGEDGWNLQIMDDGKGFNAESLNGGDGHYGLDNLKERSKAAGITLNIESQENKGTLIELLVQTDQ